MFDESSWFGAAAERVGVRDPYRWFLAQLKPNSLAIASRNLNRQGFRTFCPLSLETRRAGPRFKTVPRPLFPGYVFVVLDVTQGQWRAVNSTVGVTKLVSFGARPAEVPRGLVEQLVLQCGDDGMLLPPEELAPGDAILISYGPFAGLRAQVERIDADQRVWVLLEFMGQKSRVGFDRDAVKRDAS